MNRDKQIEEMAKDLCNNIGVAIVIVSIREDGTVNLANSGKYLKNLVDKGYRKASEVAREIFAEIEAIKCVGLLPPTWIKQFAELKKKYTEREKENEI